MTHAITIGTRGSDLAMWQATFVASQIQLATGCLPKIVEITTTGDQTLDIALSDVDGTGFFTTEVEQALLGEHVDIAVHSFKDLPTADRPGLTVAAIPKRGPVRDVLIARTDLCTHTELKWGLQKGATIGTSSRRRCAHIKSIRPDFNIVELRGNVPTRFNKVVTQDMDAVILAEAGVHRLDLNTLETQGICTLPLDPDDVCPAPSQGALAIQIRTDDVRAANAIAHMHDENTARCVNTERALLSHFGGGCHLPLGALCTYTADQQLHLRALVASPDGSERIFAQTRASNTKIAVANVHGELVRQGAERYLK